jgi:hypothetical protein
LKVITWGNYNRDYAIKNKIIYKSDKIPHDYKRDFFVYREKNDIYGSITFDLNSQSNFLFNDSNIPRGLKVGQILKIYISDITNTKNKFLSSNNGKEFRIRKIFSRQLIVDYIDIVFGNEITQISNYPKDGETTYLNVRFKVMDKIIGRFPVSGQTEIEDIRYKIELSNTGQNIDPEDVFIFKPYDINEQGIDWTYLNKKRKELMMVRHDIFPYVGSYKALINSINYFGYNDLELYEYYRNINLSSSDFGKLYKVEIPDIFDNNVEGWTEKDFIKGTFPNVNFENTNLFNLTYKITDKEGNNLLAYSLAEVILKLQGLKYWLQKNVIPITHRILDITGANPGGINISFLPLSMRGTVPTSTINVLNINVSGRIASQQLSVSQGSILNGKVVIKEIIL